MKKILSLSALLFIMIGGYSYAQPVWQSVSPSTNGITMSVENIGGTGYVTGYFTGHIGTVDGTSFLQDATLPGLSSEAAYDVAKSHDTLYSGTDIHSSDGYLLSKLVGTAWIPSGIPIGGQSVYGNAVYDLDTLPNGDLIGVGDFSTPFHAVFRYNGSEVDSLNGLSIPGYAHTICIVGNEVFIGFEGGSSSNILVWNYVTEEPETLAEQIPGNYAVETMGTDGTNLYVALLSTATGVDEIWKFNGTEWTYLAHTNTAGGTTGFAFKDSIGYVLGSFTQINDIAMKSIASFDTTTFTFSSLGYPGCCEIMAGAFVGGMLYVGSLPIKCYGIATGIEEISKDFSLYPNPASNMITITRKDFDHTDKLRVMNLLGQTVEVPTKVEGEKLVVDITALPSGLYEAIIQNKCFKFEKL